MKTAAPPLLAALLLAGLCTATVTPHDRVSTRLSWDGDVSRIVQARCTGCHQRNLPSVVPDFTVYAKARPWAGAIRQQILDGHGYSARNGAALTPFERELLLQWIEGGAPQKPKLFPVEFSRLPATYTRLASPNPLKTIEEHQARLGGTRTIIPGLGLALRTPDAILVVDRGASERLVGRGTIVPSLAAHLASLPASTPRTRLSATAFVIGAPDEPRTEVAEVAPEGPDRFWCQMHPDVRSPAAGSCPRCAMPLVEIPPMKLDAFALEIAGATPAKHGLGITLRVKRGRRAETSFLTVHERPFHLFVIDDRLETFQHVHPDVKGETLTATVDVHGGRRYWLVADFAPVDALPQVRMAPFEYRGPARKSAPPSTTPGRMTTSAFRPGVVSRVQFEISPADLEPYLGAPAHLFLIDERLENPMHAHPIEVTDEGMGRPAFDVRFPRAGRYVLWLQVQRAGKVETMRFTADVSR